MKTSIKLITLAFAAILPAQIIAGETAAPAATHASTAAVVDTSAAKMNDTTKAKPMKKKKAKKKAMVDSTAAHTPAMSDSAAAK